MPLALMYVCVCVCARERACVPSFPLLTIASAFSPLAPCFPFAPPPPPPELRLYFAAHQPQGIVHFAVANGDAAFVLGETTGELVLSQQLENPVAIQLTVYARDSRTQCNRYMDGQWLRQPGGCRSDLLSIEVCSLFVLRCARAVCLSPHFVVLEGLIPPSPSLL